LLERVEKLAVDLGADELACDTSAHAHRLIDWYTRLGYVRIGTVNWEMVNYPSVVLAKALSQE
jgi:hypothetical protein